MADNRIQFTFEINDKGKVKVDGLTNSFVKMETAVSRVTNRLREQTVASNQSSSAMRSNISDAGLAGATLTELGRTISDSNYGIRGMANNLSQLSTLFITLVSKRGGGILGVKEAFSSLGQQLVGPLGIILLFQSFVAMLERFSMKSEQARKKTEELTKELDEQIDVVSGAIDEFQNYANLLDDIAGGAGTQRLLALTTERLRFMSKEFSKVFDNLAENEFEYIQIMRDGSEQTRRGNAAVKAITEDYKIYLKTSRDLKIALNDQGSTEGEINALLDKKIRLSKQLGLTETSRFEEFVVDLKEEKDGLEDLADIKERLIEMIDLQIEKELELDDARTVDIDSMNLDLKDNFMTQFVQTSALERIEIRRQEALAERKSFEESIDNNLMYQQEITKINEFYAAERDKLMQNSVVIASDASYAIAQVFSEQTAAHKAFSIASATLDTYVGANKALKDETIPNTFARIAAVTAVIATGLANVQRIMQVDESGRSSSFRGRGGFSARTETGGPTFNVVGASQFSQLAQAVEGRDEPVRAYVVASDVTNMQQLENNISNAASI